MIDLSKITKGRRKLAPRTLIYGFEAVGKTRFACGAPGAFVIDADRGSHNENVDRATPATYGEFIEYLDAIERGKIKCEAVVIDSITQIEHMMHLELFPGGSTIEAFDGGFGRGDTYAVNKWREALSQIERIWLQGKTVTFTAHAWVKSFNDPTGPSFDRFEIACRPKFAYATRQFVDYVLFAREEVVVGGTKAKVKATTTGVRWAYTRRCPAFDAKARGSMLFPEKVLLSWAEFASEIKKDETRADDLTKEIGVMLDEIADEKLRTQVTTYLKSYPDQIVEARNRVAARLDEHRRATSVETAGSAG